MAAVARYRRQLKVHIHDLEGLCRGRHCQCPALCTSLQSGCRSDVLTKCAHLRQSMFTAAGGFQGINEAMGRKICPRIHAYRTSREHWGQMQARFQTSFCQHIGGLALWHVRSRVADTWPSAGLSACQVLGAPMEC